MKSMVILGSTGSIGTQALDVARLRNFTVRALTSNSNIDLLEEQIREFKPEIAAVVDESRAAELRTKVADTSTRVLGGEEGICAAAQLNADKVLNSIVGIAGLKPTLAAIEAGNDIALANKETLVAGGELVTSRAKEKGGQRAFRYIPVPSGKPRKKERQAPYSDRFGRPVLRQNACRPRGRHS